MPQRNITGPCMVCGLPNVINAGPLCDWHYHEKSLRECQTRGWHSIQALDWRHKDQGELHFKCACGTEGFIVVEEEILKGTTLRGVGVSVGPKALKGALMLLEALSKSHA